MGLLRTLAIPPIALLLSFGASAENEHLLRTSEMYAPMRDEAGKEWEAIKEGLLSSFSLPVSDLLKKGSDSEWKNLLQGFSTSTSFGVPLIPLSVENSGAGNQGTRSGSAPSLSQTFSYNPVSAWKGSVTLTRRLTSQPNAPWEGEFVYSFGYSDWRPYTLSLVYANYGGNRIRPKRTQGERRSVFNTGALTAGWKFPIHPKVFQYFGITDESSMGCTLSYTMVPRWQGLNFDGIQRWKQKMSLGCKYTIWGAFYVNAAVNAFPKKQQQQPWDADFTYGFGYFDWRPGTISVQYNNYAGNRFPWRKHKSPNRGKFLNGSVSLSYSWDF